MTEAEWLTCNSPALMLEFLYSRGSERKLRLFAVACCRRMWHLLVDVRSRNVLNLAEELADKRASESQIASASLQNWQFIQTTSPNTVRYSSALAANACTGPGAWASAWHTVSKVQQALGARDPCSNMLEARVQALLLRDIIGNLFRSVVLDTAWLRWNDGTVPKIAQAIYDDRDFSVMPILADALEDAGCDNEDILDHCRQPGEHARGCWAVDLLLGKK